MKKTLIYLFIIFSSQLVYSNSTFDTIYSHPDDERINDIIEFPNFYILIGANVDTINYGSYIIKIDKKGVILKDTVFDKNSLSLRMFRIGNEIILIRQGFLSSSNQVFIVFTKMDTSLNIIFEKQSLIPDSLYLARYNVIVNSDSNFVIAGTTNALSSPPLILDPFIYIVSNMGDSLNSLFINNTLSPTDQCFDIAEKDKKYFAFIGFFGGTNAEGVFLIIDSNLAIIDTVDIPNDLYNYFSPKLINDSIFIICTGKVGYNEIFISKINEAGQIIKSESFVKKNSLAWPSYQNSMSISNDNVYFLVNVDFCMANPVLGCGTPSSIMIGKLDFDLNTKWLRYYGGDKYYHSYNILATSDGGCICIGTANDTINHNNKRDIFVVKLDSNGLGTWSQTIKMPSLAVNVFPNPVTDNLNIIVGGNNNPIAEITIYDIQGKQILQKQINASQTTLNVSSLENGVYILEGITRSGAIFREKFVKE
ncbi:MAG: T9SS type A sorting domain-containing protein [Saprospiraceae bacterium]|nr:T9SS type A sorting domain-containing protein [Saprospiraceae bacterium]